MAVKDLDKGEITLFVRPVVTTDLSGAVRKQYIMSRKVRIRFDDGEDFLMSFAPVPPDLMDDTSDSQVFRFSIEIDDTRDNGDGAVVHDAREIL